MATEFNLNEWLASTLAPLRRSPPIAPPVVDPGAYLPLRVPQYSPAPAIAPAMRALDNMIPRMTPAPGPSILPKPPTRPTSPIPSLSLEQITDIVRKGESSGNYQALNRERKGNTASGAYQYTDGTWNNYGGYAKAMLAPREVQDQRFAEDLAKRHSRYNGDIFKIIAEHYLPAAANSPSQWQQPYKLRSGRTVQPVANYIRHILGKANNPELQKAFDDYLAQH